MHERRQDLSWKQKERDEVFVHYQKEVNNKETLNGYDLVFINCDMF